MDQLFVGDKAFGVTPVKIETGNFESVKAGDLVEVSAINKGRGFQGVVKRHGFHGGPKTHGQKNRQRAPGSIGNTTPKRVLPGRRMAGHMGMERITSKNIKVVEINTEGKILFLNGAVPGYKGNKVEIYK